jgi:molybdenum cofactor cytidylyltransferase
MISAVVLAAGRAERMGEQKLLLPLHDKPVLQWVLELKLVRQRITLAHDRLHWLVNYAADRGQSTSVIAGLWAIEPRSDGALFLVGDQPLVKNDLINALIERFQQSSALIVAPSFRGQARNPVLFRRELFPELLKLKGDRGGRLLIQKYKARTDLVDWQQETPFMDIDLREDYERMKELA